VRTAALFCGVCSAAFSVGDLANAQQAPARPPAATNATTALGEIVVTARRREERLQDVPISVAAFTPERLREAQVTTARQLVGFAPSLNINSGNQRDFQRFAIRGQGATVGGSESVVAYFAEAPMSQFIAGGPGLYFDLANLQVLNGPQGTLFGRNTIGGAVLFTPQRPTFNNEGFVQAGYGSYNNKELAGVANLVAIPNVLAFRASIDFRGRDGYTTELRDGSEFDNIDYRTFRIGALYSPNDVFDNYLVTQYTRSRTNGTGIILTAVNPAGLAQTLYGSAVPPGSPPGTVAVPGKTLTNMLAQQQQLGVRVTQGDAPHWWDSDTFMAVNTTTGHLPYSMLVKNIASFSRVKVSGGFDNDGTPFPLTHFLKNNDSGQPSGFGEGRNEYLTDELQLQGAWLDGKLNWVLGGFYTNSYPYANQDVITVAAGTPQITVSHLNTTSKAVFSQFTLDLGAFNSALDNLKLTGGYRYSWDTKHYTANAWNLVSNACTTDPTKRLPNCLVRFDGGWNAPTYTLSLDYKITPQVLVYFTTGSGYKSGGFNTVVQVNTPISYQPEKVKNYEIGMKGDFEVAGMPLRANITLFKDDYSDIQRSVFAPNPLIPGSIITYLANAASATIKGVESQITWKPISDLTFDLTYSYLEASYDDYPGFRDFSLPGTPAQQITNLKGTQLPFAPKNKWGVQAAYDLPVDESIGRVRAYVNANYQSHYLTTDQQQPTVYRIGDYALVNLGVNWNSIYNKPIDLEFYMTNVTNTEAIAAGQVFYYSTGTADASYIEPRMVGFRVRYHFGGGA
jgi:iron complex outermembrane receptor protein